MADTPDLTVKILRQIRNEIRQTNTRLEQTNERLDQTNARLDQVNTRLESHERLLVRLAEDSALHTQALRQLIERVDGTNERIDDILKGPLGSTVRSHSARLDVLESDVNTLKRRTG